MNRESAIRSIAAIVKSCDGNVLRVATRSQEEYKKQLGAGEVVPTIGEYQAVGDDARAEVRAIVSEAYDDVVAVLERDQDAIAKELSAPASADDVATVQLTLSREHVTEAELAALHDRYQGHHQLAAAIRDRAAKEGFHFAHVEPAADLDAGKSRAARLYERYLPGSLMLPPESFAENVVNAYQHVDIFGKIY